MNFFVWASLYVLVGAFGWGIKMRSARPVQSEEYPVVAYLVLSWPFYFLAWLLALPFRFGQWLGKRWPG